MTDVSNSSPISVGVTGHWVVATAQFADSSPLTLRTEVSSYVGFWPNRVASRWLIVRSAMSFVDVNSAALARSYWAHGTMNLPRCEAGTPNGERTDHG